MRESNPPGIGGRCTGHAIIDDIFHFKPSGSLGLSSRVRRALQLVRDGKQGEWKIRAFRSGGTFLLYPFHVVISTACAQEPPNSL